MFGREYKIPEEAAKEFEHHVVNFSKMFHDHMRILSKRSIRNMELMQKHDWIGQYCSSLSGRPGGIIVSKGWSFDAKSAETVRRLISEGWYCMAAIQAVDKCKEHGVAPHGYCAMDPQDLLAQYVDKIEKDSFLYHDVMVDPKLWEWPGRHVVFSSFSSHAHDTVLRNAGLFVIDLPNHTVSEIMQALLQYMDVPRILMVGVDYCEPYDSNLDDSSYAWFEIEINGDKYWSNMHYCLGLQAFCRHSMVDHYTVDSFLEQEEFIKENINPQDKRSGQPDRAPMDWKWFRFFQKMILKRGKRKWSKVRTGLPKDKFKQELIDDFNP